MLVLVGGANGTTIPRALRTALCCVAPKFSSIQITSRIRPSTPRGPALCPSPTPRSPSSARLTYYLLPHTLLPRPVAYPANGPRFLYGSISVLFALVSVFSHLLSPLTPSFGADGLKPKNASGRCNCFDHAPSPIQLLPSSSPVPNDHHLLDRHPRTCCSCCPFPPTTDLA